jgi:hypothetical protein
MTANEIIRPVAGAVFEKLRVLRTLAHGRRVICFCQCQRTVTAEIGDLLSGAVTSCPRCSSTETPPVDRRP